MQDEDTGPTRGQAILRLGTFFAVLAAIAYAFCCMFTQKAALEGLTAYAATFSYTQSCDAEGNFVPTGPLNCVDLNRYVFVNGPVMKAYRKACSGKPEKVISFEIDRFTRTEISSVKKNLQWHAKYGSNTPC